MTILPGGPAPTVQPAQQAPAPEPASGAVAWGTPIEEASTDQIIIPVGGNWPQPGGLPSHYDDRDPEAVAAVAAHRSSDRSLLYPSLAKSIVGGLVAIAVILSGIVAINVLLRDDDDDSAATPAAATRTASRSAAASASAAAGASAAESAGESVAGSESEAAAESATAGESAAASPKPAAKPAPKPAAKPAPKPAPKPSAPAAAAPAPRVPLTVLNSSRIRDLAASAAGDLRAAGWTVARVDNTRYRARVTTVYYLPGQEAAARRVMREVPGVQRMQLRPKGLNGSGLTVVVTREYAD